MEVKNFLQEAIYRRSRIQSQKFQKLAYSLQLDNSHIPREIFSKVVAIAVKKKKKHWGGGGAANREESSVIGDSLVLDIQRDLYECSDEMEESTES